MPVFLAASRPRGASVESSPSVTAVRFIYDRSEVTPDMEEYHNHLVMAEVLMARAVAALQAGLRAIHPWSSHPHEQRFSCRPARSQCATGSVEYVRWYDDNGAIRAQPLTREELALELAFLGRPNATNLALQSEALAAEDQDWLAVRRTLPINLRPLNGREYRQLVHAIEVAHACPVRAADSLKANVLRAREAVATLAGLLNDYHVSPFQDPLLSELFMVAQRAHLEALADRALKNLNRISGERCPSLWVRARQRRTQAHRAAVLSRLKQTSEASSHCL